MEDAVDLARPIIEVREVVETYLGYQVVIDDWQQILGDAVAAITAFTRQHPVVPATLTRLTTELNHLLAHGWQVDRLLLEQLSADTAELMSVVVPQAVPRPDDEHQWACAAGSGRVIRKVPLSAASC